MPNDGLTASQMIEVNMRLTRDFGMTMEPMVELAGAAMARTALELLGNHSQGSIAVLVGPGGTGAVGLVAASHLTAWEVPTTVLLGVERSRFSPLASALADRLELASGHVYELGAPLPVAAVWIDALFGSGFHEPLDDVTRSLIDGVNRAGVPIVAVDIPSGLDATTGKASLPAVRANTTVTIGYPKLGLTKPYAKQLVGELMVTDVGIPPVVWRPCHVEPPTFRGKAVIRWGNQ